MMKLPRRRQFLHLAAGAVALPTVSRLARAQDYPTRPVTLIVPWPAGGTTDVALRALATATEKYRARTSAPPQKRTNGPTSWDVRFVLRVQLVTATLLVVYRQGFRSPRSSAVVD